MNNAEKHWEQIESLKSKIQSGDAIVVIWMTEDVITRGESNDDLITPTHARTILHEIKRTHDRDNGITLDVIDDAIYDHFDELGITPPDIDGTAYK